jgi:hypothetical protein
MSSIIAEDEFNPKRIADEMIKRCLDAREWHIKCYVQEEWFINGVDVYGWSIDRTKSCQ